MQEETALSEGSLSSIFITAGHMGKLIREHPWTATALGDMAKWPQSLKSALSICLNSNFPIAIYWGPQLVLLYNDAWSPIPGNKHPWALGRPAIEVWPEIWNDIEPQFQKAFKGTPGGSRDALLPMQRHGYTEECYFDFTFTPIYGESGRVEGIFNAVIETTYRVINERRATTLQRLSDSVNAITTPEEVFQKAGDVLRNAKEDVAFFFIVEFVEGKPMLRAADEELEFSERWPVNAVLNGSIKHITSVDEFFSRVPRGYWPEPPTEALITPLKENNGNVFGCIIGGLSARRNYDKDYRSFFESIAIIIGGELNTIRSLYEQRQRAEALAELDKAKTAFFSNISHEFRTPLTLMLGPLQDVLEDDKLKPEHREHLTTSHRNILRLQKLVNTLLDYSRIEAGKMEVRFEATDIGKFTEDLASSFRSAIESAGIQYVVTVDAPRSKVHVDPDMWEKIVLNLISNAFKYTRKGRIEVALRQIDGEVLLKVSDTGIGIPAEEQEKVFERFYRVAHAEGRSQEGSGIGLSMVKELIHLHKGYIRLESEYGEGTTFLVTIPVRQQEGTDVDAHKEKQASASIKLQFVEEALKWNSVDSLNTTPAPSAGAVTSRPRVLLADDNADMRSYIVRLLQPAYEVRTASNGEEAFEMAIEWVPDLILSDVMMPRIDGFGLLKKLKGSLALRSTPFIFLSARAGEEARVEGINAGADDYLVKPFSAKELVARVANHVLISRTRRQTEKEFYNLFLQSPAHIHVMKGPEHVMEFFHPLGRKFIGGRDITGMKMREALPELDGQGYFEMLDQVYQEGKSFYLPESRALFPDDNGGVKEHFFNITYLPLRGIEGRVEGVLQFTLDVTEQAKANKRIKESEERFRLLATSIPPIIWIAEHDGTIEYLSEQWERYTGVSIEEGMKKFSSFIHPEDIGLVREKWAESMRMKSDWKCEYRVIDQRTGNYRWFSGHTQPLINEEGEVSKWLGSASDIHAQKTANEELEKLVAERTTELIELNKVLQVKNDELSRAQTFLQTVLDSSVELVCAFDRNLNYTFVNRQLSLYYKVSLKELLGKSLLEVQPGLKDRNFYERLTHALKGETVHIDAFRPNGDDSLVFEVFAIPLKRNDEITGVVTMQRDITAIIQLTENLRISNDRLKRSNEDLQQFAHVTSHDLKEPVRKIKVYGDLLNSNYAPVLPEKGKDYLGKIERATNRIWSMIDGVLKYSSLDAVNEAFQPIDLNDVVRHIVEDLEVTIQETGARIEYRALPTLHGSSTLLYQLFYNLINNALKFRKPAGQPHIEIRTAQPAQNELAAYKEELKDYEQPGRYVRIELRDNGIGFDQVYSEKIFESFSRLNSKDKYEGTGLGLALCKKIVMRHHGVIKATGRSGEGATFVMYLPR